MSAAPGSVGWLLRHELRMAWYNAAGSRKRQDVPMRRPATSTIAVMVLGWLILHCGAWLVLRTVGTLPSTDPRILVLVSSVLLVATTFMLSSAMRSSVLVMFERSDLDLLLSSPLPSRSIFTVRMLRVALTSATLYLILLAPFAHAGLLLGQWRWLGIYPGIVSLAVLSACAAMLITLALVRLLGARRTRVVAQILGALAGAFLFIVSQGYAQSSRDMQGRARAMLAETMQAGGPLPADSPVWTPARAVLGEPWAMLAMALLAGAVFTLTVGLTHRYFAHGLQQAASSARTPAARKGAPRHRFGRSLFKTVVFKEWRLIARDPQLLSQVLLQLLYLLPLAFLIFKGNGMQLHAIGTGVTVLCSSLAGALAWIALSAEDAPELLALSPASATVVRRAKLAAAVMPVLALVALPLLWLTWRSPIAGLATCMTVIGAVLGAGLIVFWCGRPNKRSHFKQRGKGGVVMNLLEMLNSIAWGALAWVLAGFALGPLSDMAVLGALGACAMALAVLLAAWLMRRSQP